MRPLRCPARPNRYGLFSISSSTSVASRTNLGQAVVKSCFFRANSCPSGVLMSRPSRPLQVSEAFRALNRSANSWILRVDAILGRLIRRAPPVAEPQHHECPGDRSAGAAQSPHAAAKAGSKLQRRLLVQPQLLRIGRDDGLRTVVSFRKTANRSFNVAHRPTAPSCQIHVAPARAVYVAG